MGVLITPMALAHLLHPIKSRSRNKRRNLWVGWCVSSWRPWFWPVHSIYYIHTTHYSRILTIKYILSKRHTYQKLVRQCWCIGWFVTVLFQVYFQLCVPVFSVSWYGHGMDIGTCDIVHWSAAPHYCIANRTGFWVYVVLVLNVIRCSCHYFQDRILFHHDFHHDCCDYHLDFYGHKLPFDLHFRLPLHK